MAIFTKVENIFYVSMSTEATESNFNIFLLNIPFTKTCTNVTKIILLIISYHEHSLLLIIISNSFPTPSN